MRERDVCVLQLGEDGELLEVSRRLGRDVDGSERRGQLPGRRQRAVSLTGVFRLGKVRVNFRNAGPSSNIAPSRAKGVRTPIGLDGFRWQP